MPKAFTEQEKELIGRRLLEQGYKLFSTYGLKKTNVEEIARAAGISKGAFYNFYESKESLFMDVIEEAERRVRREIFAVIDQPGISPRARLLNILKKAFTLFNEIPILQFISGMDYDFLLRRVPAEKIQSHLDSDKRFFDELFACCKQAGIPIQAKPKQIINLLYPLVLTMLHGDDLGRLNFSGSIDTLLELVAAFCLGEVEISNQQPENSAQGHEGI
jgi:AcrR family transcriptional regulator